MKRYKISLTRHGHYWCEIAIESHQADDVLVDMIERLPPEEGFALSVWEETELARLVEVGKTARVLGITYEKTPVDIRVAKKTS